MVVLFYEENKEVKKRGQKVDSAIPERKSAYACVQ